MLPTDQGDGSGRVWPVGKEAAARTIARTTMMVEGGRVGGRAVEKLTCARGGDLR